MFKVKTIMQILFETINPSDYKSVTLNIKYAFGKTQFGKYLIGVCDERVCFVQYCPEESENATKEALEKAWPGSIFQEDETVINYLKCIFDDDKEDSLKILLMGTKLQIDVWKELTNINKGSTVTYNELAEKVGNPKAIRAVASAVGKNKVSYLLPCHRVVHKSNTQCKYGSGPELKLKILEYESLNK